MDKLENREGAAHHSDAPSKPNGRHDQGKSLTKRDGKSKTRPGPTVTVCPPGEALGARDLSEWASRRRGGRAGLPCAESPHAKATGYSAYLEKVADRILAHGRGRR